MTQLAISLLGPFRVTLGNEPITQFEYDAGRALLAYLVLDPTVPHRREALAALFWPDQPEATALRNLRQVLNRLRTVIGDRDRTHPFLRITRKEVQFSPGTDFLLDVVEFETEVDLTAAHKHRRLAGCPVCRGHLARAAELYQGHLLAGLSLDSLPFQEWLRHRREQLHYRAMDIFFALATYHQALGEQERVIHYAQRQIALEPWREEAHQQLIRALALSGQRSAALAQYETCRRALAAELAVPPSAETVTLVAQVRGEQLTAVSPPMHNLPIPPTPLLGRQKALHKLGLWLTDTRYRLVTITGPGGVGKTRVALATAGALIPAFQDGVWLVPLVNLEPAQPDESGPQLFDRLATAVATALGLRFDRHGALHLQLVEFLRQKEALLLLDNFEHLLPAAPYVARLVRQSPDLGVLITSQERLQLQAERIYNLVGLPTPAAGNKEASTYSSIRLFQERARRQHPDFLLTSANLSSIIEICSLLEGLPLGIELAAGWIPHLRCNEIVSSIQQNLDILTSTMKDVPARHRSIQAVFEGSWNRLSPAEQQTLARLARFRGGFDAAAAAAVTRATV